jgi:hypothetical protein
MMIYFKYFLIVYLLFLFPAHSNANNKTIQSSINASKEIDKKIYEVEKSLNDYSANYASLLVSELNKTVPLKTRGGGGYITEYYSYGANIVSIEILNVDNAIKKDILKNKNELGMVAKSYVTDMYCLNDGMRSVLNMNVNQINKVFLSTGEFLYEYTISKSDCIE